MLDRSQAPPLHALKDFSLDLPEAIHLTNGIPVYCVQGGTQPVVKLELIFEAGRAQEQKPLLARTTSILLKEGTRQRDGSALAEALDFHGSSLSFPFHMDVACLSVYCLSRELAAVIPLIAEMLTQPVFPKAELGAFKARNKQRLEVDLTNPEVVAYREITARLFGEKHPYGYNSTPDFYEQITAADLQTHWRNNYTADRLTILISGQPPRDFLSLLDQHLATALTAKSPVSLQTLPTVVTPPPVVRHIELPESHQTAFRMGRLFPNRQHPDYPDLYVLNTLLGDYFGSRLMTNIREKKGYTYHIGSNMDSMRVGGSLLISTEISHDKLNPCLDEIHLEMTRLQEELVPEAELEMVRSYLLGTTLMSVDGPFNKSELVRTMIVEELPESFFSSLVDTVQSIDAVRLRDLAQQYLNSEDFSYFTAGQAKLPNSVKLLV